ncbi:hypothetical protein [Oceanospirillum linum]|nr:hypothetical protein [Oceanospirillum linum]
MHALIFLFLALTALFVGASGSPLNGEVASNLANMGTFVGGFFTPVLTLGAVWIAYQQLNHAVETKKDQTIKEQQERIAQQEKDKERNKKEIESKMQSLRTEIDSLDKEEMAHKSELIQREINSLKQIKINYSDSKEIAIFKFKYAFSIISLTSSDIREDLECMHKLHTKDARGIQTSSQAKTSISEHFFLSETLKLESERITLELSRNAYLGENCIKAYSAALKEQIEEIEHEIKESRKQHLATTQSN